MKTPLGDPELKMAIVRRVGTVHWRPDFDRFRDRITEMSGRTAMLFLTNLHRSR